MKITVVGTGYVGLVTGTCLAELGNDVTCVDIDEKKVEMMRKGLSPIYERGLEELMKDNIARNRLSFTTDIKSGIESAEVVINAVGTPPSKKGDGAEMKYVYQVAKDFGKYLNGYKVLVNKSTVPVGTADRVREIIAENNVNGHSFDVASNPEFLREGTAVRDFLAPDRVVVGAETPEAKELMEKLYHPITRTGRPLLITDIKSAEIIKYAANSFLATKISFINEFANFCEEVGGDIKSVAKGIGLDKRIGPRFLHAGIGYGGSCFPKDVKAIISTGKENYFDFKILQAVEEVNKKQKTSIIKKIDQCFPSLHGLKVAVWGLAFKPRTDDMREAPSIDIIETLLGKGAKVSAYDPAGMPNSKKIFQDRIQFTENAYDTLQDADVLLVLTEWDEFRSVDFDKIKSLLKKPLVIDGRNIYEPAEMKAQGFEYYCVGRNLSEKAIADTERSHSSLKAETENVSAPITAENN